MEQRLEGRHINANVCSPVRLETIFIQYRLYYSYIV